MTILFSKAERNQVNIDTLERSFVWSALLLRNLTYTDYSFGTNKDNPYKGFIKVSHSLFNLTRTQNRSKLSLQVSLPYNSQTFLRNGGQLIQSLQVVSTMVPLLPSVPFIASETPETINEPSYVDTLEKFCLWSAYELIKQNLIDLDKSIDIAINEERNPASYITINAELEFSAELFLSGLSYVEALGAISDQPLPENLRIDNGFILNNSSIIKN